MKASLIKRGRLYHAQIQLPGWTTQKRVSLHTTDKRIAGIRLEETVSEFELIDAGKLAPRAVRKAAEQALLSLREAFLLDIEATVSTATLRRYGQALRVVCQATGWKKLPDVTEAAMRQWQRESELRAATRNDYLAVWYRFFRWLKRARLVVENICEFIDRVDEHKEERDYRRALTAEEMQRLIEAAPPVRALVYRVISETGLRRCELKTSRVGDYHLRVASYSRPGGGAEPALADRPRSADAGVSITRETSAVRVRASMTKGRQAKLIPLNEVTAAELRAFFPADAAPFFQPFARCVPKVATLRRDLLAAKIPFEDALGRRVDFHSLRKTFGTALVLSGAEPRVVMEAMRHSDLKLTMKTYMDAAQLQGPVEAAVAKLPWQRKVPPAVLISLTSS